MVALFIVRDEKDDFCHGRGIEMVVLFVLKGQN